MWSATWPPEVKSLARSYCREKPVHVQIGSIEVAANHKIEQTVQVIEEEDKYHRY